MKVSELLLEYNKPHAEISKRPSAAGEKKGRMQGPVPQWLAAINDHMREPITADHVTQARSKIKASPEYEAMLAKKWRDESTEAAVKKGTFVMVRPDGQRFNILVTGKINDRTGHGGGIRASTLPRIVPNDPIATLVKTMTRSMAELAKEKVEKLSELHEGITAHEKDPAEDTIGWWIVLEKNDKAAWGPFHTRAAALNELKHNHPGYATHGVALEKIVYVEHGWVDGDNSFHVTAA